MTTTILQPGQIEPPVGEIPFLRLPERATFFARRAKRCRQLAVVHVQREFLAFMAEIALAQQAALAHFPQVPLPTVDLRAGVPPLAVGSWRRDPAWHEALRQIATAVLVTAPPAAHATIAGMARMDAESLEAAAVAMLGASPSGEGDGGLLLVAAALQVYWLHMSTTMGRAAFGRCADPTLCPVCSSAPVVSLIRVGGAEQGVRYLHCSLCAAEWHMVRSQCSVCLESKGLSYHGIAGDTGAVKAEACAACGSYLKIFDLEKEPRLDPTADDLASLSLDLMMAERGVPRSGPNLFLHGAREEG